MATWSDQRPPSNIDVSNWHDGQLDQAATLLEGMDAILEDAATYGPFFDIAETLTKLGSKSTKGLPKVLMGVLKWDIDQKGDELIEDGTYFDQWVDYVQLNRDIVAQEIDFRKDGALSAYGSGFDGDTSNDLHDISPDEWQNSENDPNRASQYLLQREEFCFLAGTAISMSEGSQKAIENVNVGDKVLSFSEPPHLDAGELISKRVTDVYTNDVSIVIDFHGTKVTPGHVMMCGDGIYGGKFVPLIDILTSDGAVVDMQGDPIRAATNAKVGSIEDAFVEIEYLERGDHKHRKRARIRVGTLLLRQDGSTVSVLECIEAAGMEFDPASSLVTSPNQPSAPLSFTGPPPRPEDYVLRVSGLTLSDIVDDSHGVEHATMRRRVYGEVQH